MRSNECLRSSKKEGGSHPNLHPGTVLGTPAKQQGALLPELGHLRPNHFRRENDMDPEVVYSVSKQNAHKQKFAFG